MPNEPEDLSPADLVNYIPALRRYALMLAGNRDLADDLVQETLSRAIEHLDRFTPGSNLRAWLMTILRNFYFNAHARKAGRIRSWQSDEEEIAYTPSTEAPQTHAVALADLWQALCALPPEQREAVLLVGMEELPYEEATAVLQVPVGAVRSRLSRARAKLLSLSGER